MTTAIMTAEPASSGASDTLNGNLNFRPVTKLSVGVMAAYNDSLLGSVPEQVIERRNRR